MTESGLIRIGGSLQWLLTGRAVQIFVQLLGIAVLARLLSPKDFGLIALAGVVTALVQIFVDMGTAAALIQRQNLEDRHPNVVFWFNVCIGVLLSILLVITSPMLARWFEDQRLMPVLALQSIALPIAALGATHTALLERDAQFRILMIRTTVAAVIGMCSAVVLALLGAGVYALVCQSLVMTATSTLMVWRASPWRPGAPSVSGLFDIAGFSGNLFFFNLLNFVHRNADTAIIGRVFGQLDLGLYNVAYRVLLFPLQNITFAINRALLPAYSRSQADPAALASHYIVTLRGIALVTAPLMAAIWVVREPMVGLLLGPAWMRSADVIQWLAPVGFLQSIIGTSGSVLAACGKAGTLRTLGLVGVPFLTAAFIVGIPWGIEGVAAAYCFANVIWLFPVLITVMRAIRGKFLMAIVAISVPAVIAVIASVAASFLLNAAILTPLGRLILALSSGSVIFLLGARLFLWDSVCTLLLRFWPKRANQSGSGI